LQAGDLVVGESVNLEVMSTNQRFRLDVKYLDSRTVYLSLPMDENKQVVTIEPGTDVKLVVTGFGKMFVYTTKVLGVENREPARLMVERTGPPEEAINRANLRMNVQIPTQVKILDAEGAVVKTVKGELLDISAGGGRLRLSEELKRDTALEIAFPLQGTEPVDTPAKVVRPFPPTRRGVFESALQFTGERAEALGDRVVKWIMDQQRKRVGR
jgi:c-di-GMP-binding flagellar brake protein YcgR